MTQKKRVVFISLLAVVCLSAYAYGAKSDSGRVTLSTVYFKNDSADAKWSTAYPRDRMKLVVARRNESSSSTIAIRGTFDTLPSPDDE